MIIHISKRGKARPDSFTKLSPMSTLDILCKVVHIIFTLPKSNVEHEFSLWRIFKPECRKLQVFDFPRVQQIDNLATVNGISSKTVRMPAQNPICFILLEK